ncbi:MAG: CRISPR-associated helicase Cas3' [Bryobacterales bacterium]|nr:CRISPR-associated helicase Cas3' [Bryobacterales bacterium]
MTDTSAGSPQDSGMATAWAKSARGRGGPPSGWLSLVDHSIDVTAVAEALLRLPTVRSRLEALAGRALDDTDTARLCFLAGLHDAGKVNHGFQAKLRSEWPQAGHIAPIWAAMRKKRSYDPLERRAIHHIGSALMKRHWRTWFEDKEAVREFWGVILAHHGSLPSEFLHVGPDIWRRKGSYDPISALVDLAAVVSRMTPAALRDGGPKLPSAARFQHAFAGLVTLADWLGSDDTVFRYPSAGSPSREERIPWARRQAANVLERRGIDPRCGRAAAMQQPDDFSALFPGLASPRPAQQELLGAPLPKAGQVIVLEAETGSGKTEAALIHFLRLFRAGEVDGLYFALPTRAAAVQIHGRIAGMVGRWLGAAAPPVGLAVPGYLRVDDLKGTRLPDEYAVLWPDHGHDRGWAVENPKRYLSGAVMVGTIDQVLLSGVRVRHAPFRSGPLLRLLLCVDEVHASDAYMATLLRNVLNQHIASGGHALLMSATLGSLARMRFLSDRVEAHQEPTASAAALAPFPSIQRSGDEDPIPLPGSGSRAKLIAVDLRDWSTDEHYLLTEMATAAGDGAIVLFIRNRVDDAVTAVRQLEAIGAPLLRCRWVVAPHHSRYAAEDRRRLDRALEEAFRNRGGVIAVTTQTAEQSLDIDADWLVTDIAPGDVLLQRIGRLHRHDRRRPPGYEAARVTVQAPTQHRLAETLDDRGVVAGKAAALGLGTVYENLVGILATRKWLEARDEIRVPQDNRALVEAATHRQALDDLAQTLGDPWRFHREDVEGRGLGNAQSAHVICVDWEEPLVDNQPPPDLDERHVTRLGLKDRSITLECPMPGPFGRPVQTFKVPGWMVPDEPGDADVCDVASGGGEIRFRIGSKGFCYSRFGLMPE